MAERYTEQEAHPIAVDVIIFGFDGEDLNVLLVKRSFDPGRGEWSLMGGFLKSHESLDDAAKRILTELTGIHGIYLEQIQAYGDPGRDPGGRVVSISYYALIEVSGFSREQKEKFGAQWFRVNQLPGLIFDHNAMISNALKRLRRKCKTQPIGFELLPAKFTLPRLMALYEAIYSHEFDKRNFRKKILSFGVLRKLDEKDTSGSRKGAWLYTFDKEKYNKLLREGANFEITA